MSHKLDYRPPSPEDRKWDIAPGGLFFIAMIAFSVWLAIRDFGWWDF